MTRRKIRKIKGRKSEIVNNNTLTPEELNIAKEVVGILKYSLPVVYGKDPVGYWVKFNPDGAIFIWVNKEGYEEDVKNNKTVNAIATLSKETGNLLKINVKGEKRW